jgi:hypothetical protein
LGKAGTWCLLENVLATLSMACHPS